MLLANQLNSSTADALCTVITLGFLSLDNRRKIKSNFLRENGNGDANEHIHLRGLMQASGINELSNLMPYFEIGIDKQDHPFIYARRNAFDATDGLNDIMEQIRIDGVVADFVAELEAICNLELNNFFANLRGAYVGGVAESKMVRLLFPSLMYQYQIPNYVNADNRYLNDINVNRGRFCDVTERVLELFRILMPLTTNTKIQFWSTNEDLLTLIARMNEMNRHFNANQLIASVHGLVTSLVLAPPGKLADGNYNVELALSSGTTKVASCIPCAIFAMSQGAPASFTHFGRGDYWNLPEGCNIDIRRNWEFFVNNCYAEGMNILGVNLPIEWSDFFHNLSIEHQNSNFTYIPEVFLSALTFQSSFMTKMTNVIEIINAINERW